MSIPKSNGAKESSLAIQILIDERSRELGLSRSEIVRRCGYKNISKGIRRLDELYAGDLQGTAHLLAGLSIGLELSPDVVQRALNDTNQQLGERASRAAAEAEAAWRATFKPHGILLGTQERPSQIFIFAVTGGAERWLKIPLDLSQPPVTYAEQALAVVHKTPSVQFFGRTTGFIVNYTPDHAVRFDREGQPVETLARAYRPGEATVSLGRRPVSAEAFGKALGTWPTETRREALETFHQKPPLHIVRRLSALPLDDSQSTTLTPR
jgi:hypothetical protein